MLYQGYNKSIDWWATGIIIYEMLFGKTPFCDDTIDDETIDKIKRKIKTEPLAFPARSNTTRYSQ